MHVEKTLGPGFGQVAMSDLISRAIGVAPDLPKTCGTGCGKRRKLSDTTTVPEKVTCLPCAEWARAQNIEWAEMHEALFALPDAEIVRLTKGRLNGTELHRLAAEYRAKAARFPAA